MVGHEIENHKKENDANFWDWHERGTLHFAHRHLLICRPKTSLLSVVMGNINLKDKITTIIELLTCIKIPHDEARNIILHVSQFHVLITPQHYKTLNKENKNPKLACISTISTICPIMNKFHLICLNRKLHVSNSFWHLRVESNPKAW